jgi:hypothetical protein
MITTTSTQGMTGLARDTAASLGHLIDQHVQIARVELAAELKQLGRRARLVVVLAALVAVGYALAMAGVAILFGGGATVGMPLVIVGLAHLTGAGAALIYGPLRPRAAELELMESTTAAVGHTVAVLGGRPPPIPGAALDQAQAHAR